MIRCWYTASSCRFFLPEIPDEQTDFNMPVPMTTQRKIEKEETHFVVRAEIQMLL